MDARFLRIGAQGVTVSTVAVVNAHRTLQRLRKHSGAAIRRSRRSSTVELHPPGCPRSALLMHPLVERWSDIFAFFKVKREAWPCRGIPKMGRRFSSVVRDAPTVTWPPARADSSPPICRLTVGRVRRKKFATTLSNRVNRRVSPAGLSPSRLVLV
jgi:hypothetical protein